MTAAALLVEFLSGATMRDLARRHGVPRGLVEDELRWCFRMLPTGRARRRGTVPQQLARSSHRWPLSLDRFAHVVDTIDSHQPISSADLGRRLGCTRRVAAMSLTHLEDLGFVDFTWERVPTECGRVGRRKLWSLT